MTISSNPNGKVNRKPTMTTPTVPSALISLTLTAILLLCFNSCTCTAAGLFIGENDTGLMPIPDRDLFLPKRATALLAGATVIQRPIPRNFFLKTNWDKNPAMALFRRHFGITANAQPPPASPPASAWPTEETKKRSPEPAPGADDTAFQLSIMSPLDVLREKMILNIANRRYQMKALRASCNEEYLRAAGWAVYKIIKKFQIFSLFLSCSFLFWLFLFGLAQDFAHGILLWPFSRLICVTLLRQSVPGTSQRWSADFIEKSSLVAFDPLSFSSHWHHVTFHHGGAVPRSFFPEVFSQRNCQRWSSRQRDTERRLPSFSTHAAAGELFFMRCSFSIVKFPFGGRGGEEKSWPTLLYKMYIDDHITAVLLRVHASNSGHQFVRICRPPVDCLIDFLTEWAINQTINCWSARTPVC